MALCLPAVAHGAEKGKGCEPSAGQTIHNNSLHNNTGTEIKLCVNGHSPSNDQSVTGTDVTQHFSQFILQMADGPNSIL